MNIETYQKMSSNKSFDWGRWCVESKLVNDEMTPEIDRMIREDIRLLRDSGEGEVNIKRLLMDKIRQIRSDAEDRLFEEKFA